jgi:hypothetical protein
MLIDITFISLFIVNFVFIVLILIFFQNYYQMAKLHMSSEDMLVWYGYLAFFPPFLATFMLLNIWGIIRYKDRSKLFLLICTLSFVYYLISLISIILISAIS